MKVYRWVVVGLLWPVALLNYMDRQMLSTMRPSMQIDIGALQSAENFGRLMAIFLWTYGILSPFAGMIADRISRKKLIVFSLFVWSGVTFAMGYASSFNQLYWLRGIMGISECVYIPSALALITDYHKGSTRSLAVGVHMTGLYIGQALGGFGDNAAEWLSWQRAFTSIGFVGMAYAIVLIIFLRDNRNNSPTVKINSINNRQSLVKGLSLLFSNISFWVLFFYFAAPSLPGWGIKNWLPTLFAVQLNIDMTAAGPLSTITIAASSFLGVIVGGILSDWWSKRSLRGRIYTSAIGLGLTIPALLLVGFGSSLWALIFAAFCFGFGFGMFDANNMPILCQFVPSSSRATAYGILNMGGVFAGALITSWLGKSTDAGNLGRDFAFLSIIVLAVLIVQLKVLQPQTMDADDPAIEKDMPEIQAEDTIKV